MTDWYIYGYKITLVSLRGGASVIVVRFAADNRYIRHFNDITDFDRWIAKETYYGEVKCEEEA
jgi:hypothetical protein